MKIFLALLFIIKSVTVHADPTPSLLSSCTQNIEQAIAEFLLAANADITSVDVVVSGLLENVSSPSESRPRNFIKAISGLNTETSSAVDETVWEITIYNNGNSCEELDMTVAPIALNFATPQPKIKLELLSNPNMFTRHEGVIKIK